MQRKYGVVVMTLFFVMMLSACGNQKLLDNRQKAVQFSPEDPAWLMQVKIEQAVLGEKRADILSTWGEADGSLSGFFGDIFNLDKNWSVILYYDTGLVGENAENFQETAKVIAVRVRNKDENVSLKQYYALPLLDGDPATNPGILLDAGTGVFSMGFSLISSYLPFGEYRVENDTLILETSDEKYCYYFKIDGENLIFDKEKSSFTWYAEIPDGAVYFPAEPEWEDNSIPSGNMEKQIPVYYYSYYYPVEDEMLSISPPSITLSTDGTFTYYWHPLSSYIGYGEYKVEGDTLILKTSDGKFQYCFTMDGENLVFHKENSSSTGLAKIPDAAVFVPGECGFCVEENEIIEENNLGGHLDYWSLLRKK